MLPSSISQRLKKINLLRPKLNTVAATPDVASEAMAEVHAGMEVESDHMEDMAAVEPASVIMEAVV